MCDNCGSTKLPGGHSGCSLGALKLNNGKFCSSCEDCVCPDCHCCKKFHCDCTDSDNIDDTNKVVIPENKDPAYESNLDQLREILSQLHYYTHQCTCCQWVDNEDEEWYKCSVCKERICRHCYEEHGNNNTKIECYNCSY